MSKSRGERGKTPAQLQPPTVSISNDVVPGRFTEADWTNILDEETTEDFVSDILQEVVSDSLDQIYYKIIGERIIPYTVDVAKNILLEVIEWQFLVKDPGETGVEEDKTWLADEEPEPSVTDSWAQGIVPVVTYQSQAENVLEKQEEEETIASDFDKKEESSEDFEPQSMELSVVNTTDSLQTDESSNVDKNTKPEIEGGDSIKVIPKPPTKPQQGVNKPFKPYRGKVPSFRTITMTPIMDDQLKDGTANQANRDPNMAVTSSESVSKNQHGRPLGTRDVTYDHKGDVIHVKKLNIDKLPSHRVKTRFAVVDPLEEEYKAKAANKKQRYNFFRQGVKGREENSTDVIVENRSKAKEMETKLVSPLPPPLVDTIDVSPGVVIKEKGVIKRGLRQPLNQYYSKDASFLEPLGSSVSGNTKDLRAETTIKVGPINKSRPLPAIATRD